MSVSRHCTFIKASDGLWYMELGDFEHADVFDSTTYGPFVSEDTAWEYLRLCFANPGGAWTDDSGTQPVPTKSSNGKPVQKPRR